MGTVWLARMSGKLGFERLVALKMILPTYSSDRQFCDMFLDEAKIAARIDHENVARILEIGEDRGLLYYAMELIDGESLRKLYRDVRARNMVFPIAVALRIVADACAGLHATHELRGDDGQSLQVVHRDVSPQNLLISIRGTTKLIDFGVAKANARRSEATVAGTLKGKIEYMAPEQAQGLALDRRADVYSLGAVLFELLAGRPVRVTDDGRQLAALHELMTGAPIAPLPDTVPLLVRQIVDRALARDPMNRFGSADELRRALEHAMVATGRVASTQDVANALAHFSGERSAKRKSAIDHVLSSAAHGRLNAATIVAPLNARGTFPSHGSAPGGMGGDGSAPGASGAHAQAQATATGPFLPLASPSGYPLDGSTTGPSMRTLGPASLTPVPARGGTAAKIVAGLLMLGAVAAIGIVVGMLVARREQRGAAAAQAATASAPIVTVGAPLAPEDPVPPAASTAVDPAVPATGVLGASPMTSSSSESQPAPDASATTTTKAKGHGRKPGKKPPASAGAKPGDNDEYGF